MIYGITQKKDETSETIVQNFFSPFSCIQGSVYAQAPNWLISVLNQLTNHQNTQQNAETKIKL